MPPDFNLALAGHAGAPLAILLAVTLSLSGCGSGESTQLAASARPVLVSDVQHAPLGGLTFAGEVRARERAELSFAVPGVVREVLVDVGATVRRGQLLARIDAAPQQAQLAASEAEARRLQALLADAHRREQRMRAAHEGGAATDSEWTAVQAEVLAAHEALTAAQAQRGAAAWSREQTELRAPFDGRVALRQLEVGQIVGAGALVLELDGRGRELWLVVPASLPLGVGHTFWMSGPSGKTEASVLQLSARLEAGGSRRVLLSVPDSWPTGEAVSVQLWSREPGAQALLVPLRAVQMDPARPDQGQVLRLPDGRQVPERITVTLGALQGDQVEVHSGLKVGDRVVLAGAHALAADQPVTPVSQLR